MAEMTEHDSACMCVLCMNPTREADANKYRVLDLFSGIGGFSLGLERTGKFETVAFCEIDEYASKVLGKWWPHVPNIKGGVIALNALLKKARTCSRQNQR